MAFNWANVLVAPTGSSGLTSGTHAEVDEDPPWSDADISYLQLSSLASGTFIFNGFDLSNAGGEKKGFWIFWRCGMNSTEGFNVTITVKQDTTTLWTSAQFPVTHGVAYRTYPIRIPDSAFSGNPDIDNMSIEFACVNLRSANQRIQTSWLRLSKTPFTTAQQAVLPSPLAGQEFVCYRASDLAVLGAADSENLFLLPDASGEGRHAILLLAAATYESDTPEGILADSARFAGALGFDPTTATSLAWTGNKIFHLQVTPTSVDVEQAIFSVAAQTDFIEATPASKHILGIIATTDEWVMMSGDGSGAAHKQGGTVVVDVEQRVTEWVQVGGGNEHLWEEDDASPVVDDSSGDNPFSWWSLLNRESDDRPFVGRLSEFWAVEATGITEGEIDTARDEWVGGAPPPTLIPVQIHRQRRIRVR